MDCPRCGRAAPADARFCPGCGARLAADAARFAAPDAYTPAHLAERILASRGALADERKQVTVLFADLQGSMALTTDRDPEEAGRYLDRVLDLMMEAVHRYEGTVNQVMGDGVMALFGAPLAHEDHAVRACCAALRMQERIGAWGDAVQRAEGVPLQIRVGLNSGEVVVRSIANDLRITYTAVGQTVHLAARMEQIAKPGTILATAETVALVGARVRTRPLGPVAVKGRAQAVDVHEIVGAGKVQSRVAAAARDLTRFVGRARELEALEETLAAVQGGAGRIVAVVGDAGVGKSRLLHEFARRARDAGALVLETVAVSYGRALAHRPGIEMLRGYFGIDAGDDARAVREKVAGRMTALDPVLEEGVPALLWQLGALRAEHPFLALDADARRRRVVDAVRSIVEREGRTRPVVLVFEDVQWLDSETRDALDALAERLPPRALLLASCRPPAEEGWAARAGARVLSVAPLDGAPAMALLGSLVGADPSVAPLLPLLLERAGGNPLFLEESVKSLVDAGVLDGARGAHRLVHPLATLEVPPTVRAVLEARIDRLMPEQKRLLQAAAVIGEEVPTSLLEAVAETPPEAIRRGLARLADAGFLEETALFPDLEYRFRHSLTHDVAYEGLLHERRRALHARIAEELEREDPGDAEGRVARLAHHAFRGERWEAAVRYLREAGARAVTRFALREAVSFYERALEAVGHLGETPGARVLAIDLRCDLHNALLPLGDHARLLVLLREAEALATAAGDEPRLARTLSLVSNNLWHTGASDDSLAAGGRALAIAERLGDLDLQVAGHFSLGGATRALGDYPRAAGHLRRMLELLGSGRERATFGLAGLASVLARSHLAWSLAELGEFTEAVTHAEDALRIATAAEHAYTLAHAHLGLGGVLLRQGRIGEAMGVLERGVAVARDVPFLFPPLAGDLAVVYAVSGRVAVGLELAARAVLQAERMGRLGRLSLITTHDGETNVLAGRMDVARARGERALALAREHKERGNEVYALRLLGVVAAEGVPADLETARARFEEARALAEKLGMRPLLARCLLGLGRVARRAGDAAEARRLLDRAAALLRELGMQFWLDRLALDRVGPPA